MPNGKAVMAGPVYYFDATHSDPQRLPPSYDGHFFWWDFSKGLIYDVAPDMTIEPFLEGLGFGPALNNGGQNGTIDMQIGVEGTLFVLEMWSGTLYRVNYLGPDAVNRSPVVVATAGPEAGPLPHTVTFSAGGTYDPDGDPLTYAWDFDGDNVVDSTLKYPPPQVYTTAGEFTPRLTVSDPMSTVVQTFHIVAGNSPPEVTITWPPAGSFFNWGDVINFEISVADAEDGTTGSDGISCTSVVAAPALGHDGHDHGDLEQNTCTGTFTAAEGSHKDDTLLYYLLRARHTDLAQGAAPSVTGTAEILLHPMRREAEFAEVLSGVRRIPNSDPWSGGSEVVSGIDDGDYVVLAGRNLMGMQSVSFRVASGTLGGAIEVRLDSPTGEWIGNANVTNTGSFCDWETVSTDLWTPAGFHDIYFVFRSAEGHDAFDLNWIEFSGESVGDDETPPFIESIRSVSESEVQIRFSEFVAEDSVTEPDNYELSSGRVRDATLLPDGLTVLLRISRGNLRTERITVSRVRDLLGNSGISSGIFTPVPGGVGFGLEAYWAFRNEPGSTVTDLSGNGNHATLAGGAARSTEGARDDSVFLDGNGAWVDIPDLAFPDDFTISAWVKLSEGIDQNDSIVGQIGNGQDMNFYAGQLRLYGPGDQVVAG
ncbi:MAG: carbohydrate-binding protein, partial [Planctomycetota bacterium]